jgi:hypothetical protein
VAWRRGGLRSRRARARGRAGTSRAEAGVTLLEIQIGIALLGLVMTAFMGALITTASTSDIERRGAIADAELRRYVDYVRSMGYVPCAQPDVTGTPSGYAYAPIANLGNADGTSITGVSGTVTKTEYYQATSTWNGTWTVMPPSTACPPETRLQRVTLSISVAGVPNVTRMATVVKRWND